MATKSESPQFESWGRYPSLRAEVIPLSWASDFPLRKTTIGAILPVGMGRSYGDVCLLDGGTLLKAKHLDRFLSFDTASGILRCEAGVTFAEILKIAVPRGWFLPVTPGTKYVTLGGAIASDVHGKNHHVAGCLGNHVLRFELVRSDGSRMVCSPEQNQEWYYATIGGMGLTGLIAWAEFQMRPIVSPKIDYEGIQFHGIDEFFSHSLASAEHEYTVAWIDCISSGRNFCRGIFMRGFHSSEPAPLVPEETKRLKIPCSFPAFFLNAYSLRAFNELYYRKQSKPYVKNLVSYDSFFYPLDSVLEWNRVYGKRGVLQFQCALPEENGREGIVALLREITAARMASPLAVLKTFGKIPSPGMMSFPRPGVTLAVDFPIHGEKSFRLYDRLAELTAEFGGRMYPAKDSRMTAAQFQAFYPQWKKFSRYIDPGFSSAFWQRVAPKESLFD